MIISYAYKCTQKNESNETHSSLDEGSVEKCVIVFTAFKLSCCQCSFYTHQNADYRLATEKEIKKRALPEQGRLLFVFTKSTTINFQNTVTAAQVHLLLSYYSSTFFNAVFCACISSCYALNFEPLTTGDIIRVAIEIRQAYCYLYYGIT